MVNHVFLKVSPSKGVTKFNEKGKLKPRFVGPFKVLRKVGEVAYGLALPLELSHVHNVCIHAEEIRAGPLISCVRINSIRYLGGLIL